MSRTARFSRLVARWAEQCQHRHQALVSYSFGLQPRVKGEPKSRALAIAAKCAGPSSYRHARLSSYAKDAPSRTVKANRVRFKASNGCDTAAQQRHVISFTGGEANHRSVRAKRGRFKASNRTDNAPASVVASSCSNSGRQQRSPSAHVD
jgi:hypothetical protein